MEIRLEDRNEEVFSRKAPPNLPRSVMENIIHTLFRDHEERHEIIEYENYDTQIFFTEQLVH